MKLKVDNVVLDPQELESPQAFVDNLLSLAASFIKVCLPAKIISFDRANGVCSAALMVRPVSKAGLYLTLPDLVNIPVVFPEGGGYGLNLPLKPGDCGYIVFNDVDIAKFKETLSLSSCNTGRQHDFCDGVFIPAGLRQISVSAEDEGRAVFQNLGGSIKISLGQSDIKIKGDTELTGNLTVKGDVEVSGDISAQGAISSGKTVTAAIDVIGGGISLKGHTHGGVTSGGSNTGPAQ